jgi:hypothetical protein
MPVVADIRYYFGIHLTVGCSPFSGVTDITGWTMLLTIRDKIGGTVLLTGGTDDGSIVITDAVAGNFNIVLTTTQTQTLPAKTYVYDIHRTDQGFEDLLATGVWQVDAEVRL